MSFPVKTTSGKKHAKDMKIEDEDVLVVYFLLWAFLTYLSFYSIEITPPPTPSPVKAEGGKKCAMRDCESDDDDVFVPRYDIVSIVIFKNLFW